MSNEMTFIQVPVDELAQRIAALLKGEIIAEISNHFDDFLGMAEASKLTGVTPDTMRKYIKDGKIKNYTQSIGRPRLSRNECIELQKEIIKKRRI